MAAPRAVPTDGDLPTQDTVGRLALEANQLAWVVPCAAQRGSRGARTLATRHEMDAPRGARDRGLQAAVVAAEPASAAGSAGERVDGDDFQVRGRMRWRADREHPVVGAHEAVLAAGSGRAAERG